MAAASDLLAGAASVDDPVVAEAQEVLALAPITSQVRGGGA